MSNVYSTLSSLFKEEIDKVPAVAFSKILPSTTSKKVKTETHINEN